MKERRRNLSPTALLLGCFGLTSCSAGVDCVLPGDDETALYTVGYDKFADVTTVNDQRMLLGIMEWATLVSEDSVYETPPIMSISYECPGRTHCRPDTLSIVFKGSSMLSPPFRGADSVRFLLNGEDRIAFGRPAYEPDSHYLLGKTIYTDYLAIRAPYSVFKPAICSDEIEFQVGGSVGALDPEQRAALRAMFSELPFLRLASQEQSAEETTLPTK